MILPTPERGADAAVDFVARHLVRVCGDDVVASPAFRGEQSAADEALAGFSVRGYASRRNQVWPPSSRGASRLSPYIRHGLLALSEVWDAVEGGPARDVAKFRDELLWQEYARHLYGRVGTATARGLREEPTRVERGVDPSQVWDEQMACLAAMVDELHRDGWLVNQARMWLASHWAVRAGVAWTEGEDHFFRHLLDGSRAANRLGWQWTTGVGSAKPYGFSRTQVEKRAPDLCAGCALRRECPISSWPGTRATRRVDEPDRMRADPDPEQTGGPRRVEHAAVADAVWLTGESLGDRDPALRAHPDLPVVFVFDEPLLAGLQLSSKRLVFLVERLAELAATRDLELRLGPPAEELAGRSLAVTFAPVPGFRRLSARIRPAVVHPWRWLCRPHGRSVRSFSAWRRAAREPREPGPSSVPSGG